MMRGRKAVPFPITIIIIIITRIRMRRRDKVQNPGFNVFFINYSLAI